MNRKKEKRKISDWDRSINFKVRVRNIEDRILYYGCKDSWLLCRKLKHCGSGCSYFLKA